MFQEMLSIYILFTPHLLILPFLDIHFDSKIQFFEFSSLVRAKERVNRPGTRISFNLGAAPT